MWHTLVQIEFTRPWWLLMLALLPFLVWASLRSLLPRLGVWCAVATGVRMLLVAMLVVALAKPRLDVPSTEKFVVFVVDRSPSIDQASNELAWSFVKAALHNVDPNRALILPFSDIPWQPIAGQNTTDEHWQTIGLHQPGQSLKTNLEHALRSTWGFFPGRYVPQVLLLSDGRQTHGDALEAGRQSSVPIDVVPLVGCERSEVCLRRIAFPGDVRQGEPLNMDLWLWASRPVHGTVHIAMQPGIESSHAVTVAAGENHIRVRVSCERSGVVRVIANLTGFDDQLKGNNCLQGEVFVRSRPRAMLLQRYTGDEKRLVGDEVVTRALRSVGIDVEQQTLEAMDSVRSWEGWDLLVLSNVPATALKPEDVTRLAAYVRGGGGLLVLGGPNAFTPGGYAGSDLEKLLPLLAIAKAKTQAVLALVLVVDCSESMQGERMELARQAARRAVDQLQAQDLVGVLAYEDRPQWIVPLAACTDKRAVAGRIGGLEASGRTNLAPALARTYLALRAAFADRKHAILLTDGISYVDDFGAIVRQMAQSEISLSCVALGEEAAGPMLRELARVGRGRYYECRDAASVPRIFAVEALAAGQRGIHEGAVRALAVQGQTPAPLDLPELPVLLGCNESRLAQGAVAWLQSDEGDPLLAIATVGQGRVAAFAADLQGGWSAPWLEWSGFNSFWSETAQRLLRQRPVVSLPTEYVADYPPELQSGPADLDLLRGIAEASGGRYAPRPEEVFAPSERTVARPWFLWPYLLVASIVLLVVDKAIRTLGPRPG